MTRLRRPPTTPNETLRQRTAELYLSGLLTHWEELADSLWVEYLFGWEETERSRRSLERRFAATHIGRFNPLADSYRNWPEQCDRLPIDD